MRARSVSQQTIHQIVKNINSSLKTIRAYKAGETGNFAELEAAIEMHYQTFRSLAGPNNQIALSLFKNADLLEKLDTESLVMLASVQPDIMKKMIENKTLQEFGPNFLSTLVTCYAINTSMLYNIVDNKLVVGCRPNETTNYEHRESVYLPLTHNQQLMEKIFTATRILLLASIKASGTHLFGDYNRAINKDLLHTFKLRQNYPSNPVFWENDPLFVLAGSFRDTCLEQTTQKLFNHAFGIIINNLQLLDDENEALLTSKFKQLRSSNEEDYAYKYACTEVLLTDARIFRYHKMIVDTMTANNPKLDFSKIYAACPFIAEIKKRGLSYNLPIITTRSENRSTTSSPIVMDERTDQTSFAKAIVQHSNGRYQKMVDETELKTLEQESRTASISI